MTPLAQVHVDGRTRAAEDHRDLGCRTIGIVVEHDGLALVGRETAQRGDEVGDLRG